MYGPLVFVRLSRRLVFLHGVRVIEVKLLPVLHPLVLPAILCERLQQFGREESFIVAKDLCVNVPVSYEALVFVLTNAHYICCYECTQFQLASYCTYPPS